MIKISHFLPALIFLVFSSGIKAQPACHFEHFSIEDGLPQYTIMDIIQDDKGFIWLATWDGLSKFDGYTFKNFKVHPGDNYRMISNRIDKIQMDKHRRIWFTSYDGEAHCFNKSTEEFWGIQSIKGYENSTFIPSVIKIMPSGKVWLISNQNGAICVMDTTFNALIYNQEINNLNDNNVNSVFEGKSGETWLLTENGICWVQKNGKKTINYFNENKQAKEKVRQPFYSAYEAADCFYFGSKKGRVWQYSKKERKFDLIKLNADSEIIEFREITANQLLLTTLSDGFFLLDLKTGIQNAIKTTGSFDPKTGNVNETYIDRHGILWIITENVGIYNMNIKTGETRFFKIKIEDESTNLFPPRPIIFEDINGKLWVQPRGGGFSLFNEETGNLDPFHNDPLTNSWRFSNVVHSAFSDKQGNLWTCTRSHGLEKIVFDREFFIKKNINDYTHSVGNEVRVVFEDREGNIWVSTRDKRITLFDKNKNKIGNISEEGKIKEEAFFPSVVYCIIEDKNGNIWIGTKGDGIYKFIKQNGKGNWKSEHFVKKNENLYSLSSDNVYSIYQDKSDNIWVGTWSGGINLIDVNDEGKTIFINHRNNLNNFPIETCNRVRYITENNKGHLCVGTTGGLLMFNRNFKQPESIIFKQFTRIPGNKESLSNNDVHGICTTKKGEMYLVTFGGGLNKVISYNKDGYPEKFNSFTVRNGLPSDITLAITEDKNGMLWVSTENNLAKFDPSTKTFRTFAEINRFMKTNTFSEASNSQLRNGEIIFGYSKGLLYFKPELITNKDFKPYIAFTGFQLFNKEAKIMNNSPLTRVIDEVNGIKLKHNQNYFTIEFAALDFEEPGNIHYTYKLDGFDKEWNYTQKQRLANYTNIPRGDYIFRVKSTNSEGIWTENERNLLITVKPSFWETPFAWILYFLLFTGIVILCIYVFLKIYRLEANVKLEKKLSEMKLRFLVDISHEIRTPLTMVTAPVEFMLSDKNTPDCVKKQLRMVSHNTNRILRLVNQILDFRKMQFMKLKVVETEVSNFVMDIFNTFTDIAEKNNITFQFIDNAVGEKIWVDRECLEKIVMNLLSNAFKYTPNGGLIKVSVSRDEKNILIKVSDNGPGISKEKQKKLFTRFSSFNEDKSKPSTGIGLSMVKDLAEKHSAKVFVESEPGKGSNFIVSFQTGYSHFDSKEIALIASDFNETDSVGNELKEESANFIENQVHLKKSSEDNSRLTVLIVEDDSDLRTFLNNILSDDYNIIEAENGVEGLKTSIEKNPDFIISDIMMPIMDGIELLHKLREEITTSHIPIVLLTAKANIESKLEGLSYGADDYITKPFSVQYFKARIANLILQRKHLQEIYRTNLQSKNREFDPEPFMITPQDDLFMQNVVQVIEKNMDNSNFTVEVFGQSVGMSRTAFFNKIKSLTGLSPVEFIRDIRLKRAKQLLETNQLLIKEVAYMTGFSDTKYFGECFKTKYGITPMEFKKTKRS